MDVRIFLLTAFLSGVRGLLINLNQTHGPSISDRLDALEKQITEEKRQRYLIQLKYDEEREKIEHLNETNQKLLQVYNSVPKRFQDVSTQIRGVLLSINNLDTRQSTDLQTVLGTLRDVQTSINDLTLNQSDIIEDHLRFKHNLTINKEDLGKLKSSLASLRNNQRTLESIANANKNKQINLQTELNRIITPVIFLAVPTKTLNWLAEVITSPVHKNGVVRFPNIKVNVGGGYSSDTGVFTCPSEGYYTFHWSLTSADSSRHCTSVIMKNGIEIIENEDGGNLATFHMNTNDRAWIKTSRSCTTFSYRSSFSGFKII